MCSHDLTISQVAQFAECHRNTVKRYAERGHLKPMRDVNGYRRFSRQDAKKLKELLSMRKPSHQSGEAT